MLGDPPRAAVHPLTASLAADGVLRCPRCAGALDATGPDLACSQCDTRLLAFTGVLDAHGFGTQAPATDAADDPLLPRLRDALELPDDDQHNAALADILARAGTMKSAKPEYDAEIRDVADRFGIELDGADSAEPLDLETSAEALAFEVERHYVPASLPPASSVVCNVRVRNRGAQAVPATGDLQLLLGYRWIDPQGRPIPADDHRTPCPIVLAPDRGLTLPVRIATPAEPGMYQLAVSPVLGNGRWLPEFGMSVPVRIEAQTARDVAMHLDPQAPTLDYTTDHAAALELLEEQLSDKLTTPGRRLLEIGGGAHPQIAWFGPHDTVVVDINLPLMELGSLWYAHHHFEDEVFRRLAFVCADANNLPLADQTFDAVVMFATLHHFPDPERLLAECRRLVKPDGLVAVLCEPVGSTLESGVTLRDLNKGINEQVFTADGYLRMFAAAGLEPVGGSQIGGSLRAFLRVTEPSGERFDVVKPIPEEMFKVFEQPPAEPSPAIVASPPARAPHGDAALPLAVRARRFVERGLAATWNEPSRFKLPGRLARRAVERVNRPIASRQQRAMAELAQAVEAVTLSSATSGVPPALDASAVVDVETVHGPLFMHRGDEVMTPAIQQTGRWEPAEERFLLDALRPGAVFVDVGANVGYFSVVGAKAVQGSGRVFSIEPEPRNLALLRANVWRHGLNNVAVLPMAAAAEPAYLLLKPSEANRGDHQVYPATSAGSGSLVPAGRLDEVLAGLEPDVIKIDTQGADHLVVAGLTGLVRPGLVLLVEFWLEGMAARGVDPRAVVDGYLALGLRIELLTDEGPVPTTAQEAVEAARGWEGQWVNLVLRA